jgi:hypothetical protein
MASVRPAKITVTAWQRQQCRNPGCGRTGHMARICQGPGHSDGRLHLCTICDDPDSDGHLVDECPKLLKERFSQDQIMREIFFKAYTQRVGLIPLATRQTYDLAGMAPFFGLQPNQRPMTPEEAQIFLARRGYRDAVYAQPSQGSTSTARRDRKEDYRRRQSSGSVAASSSTLSLPPNTYTQPASRYGPGSTTHQGRTAHYWNQQPRSFSNPMANAFNPPRNEYGQGAMNRRGFNQAPAGNAQPIVPKIELTNDQFTRIFDPSGQPAQPPPSYPQHCPSPYGQPPNPYANTSMGPPPQRDPQQAYGGYTRRAWEPELPYIDEDGDRDSVFPADSASQFSGPRPRVFSGPPRASPQILNRLQTQGAHPGQIAQPPAVRHIGAPASTPVVQSNTNQAVLARQQIESAPANPQPRPNVIQTHVDPSKYRKYRATVESEVSEVAPANGLSSEVCTLAFIAVNPITLI